MALGRGGNHFLEVLRGGISTFVEPQQGTHKVDMAAGIVLDTLRYERFLFFHQRMEGFCLSRIHLEVRLRELRGGRPCRAPSKE